MRTYDRTFHRLSKSSRVRHICAKMLFLTKATAALIAQCPGSSALTCEAVVIGKKGAGWKFHQQEDKDSVMDLG